MWYAAARYESVSQTRRFFRDVVMGFGRGEAEWRELWERENSGMGSPMGNKGKGRERERERTPRKRGSGSVGAG